MLPKPTTKETEANREFITDINEKRLGVRWPRHNTAPYCPNVGIPLEVFIAMIEEGDVEINEPFINACGEDAQKLRKAQCKAKDDK